MKNKEMYDAMVNLVWDNMEKASHKDAHGKQDRVLTSWGDKTRIGLSESFRTIVEEHTERTK